MATAILEADVLDCAAWKAMLDREGVAAAEAFVGVLTKDDFATREGSVLVWRGTSEGAAVTVRAFRGGFDPDVAMVLVADRDALKRVVADGLAQVPLLVRHRRLDPYMLRTLEDLEDAGLADFVEDFGLVFPRH